MRFASSKIDHILLITVLALLVFGLVMITSIGVPKSIQISAPGVLFPSCGSEGVDCYLILKNHLVRLGIGLIVLFVGMKINYKFWKTFSLPFFIIAITLLVVVLSFGSTNNTFAKSWINLPALPFLSSIQPAEVAKLALIFYLSSWLENKKEEIKCFKYGFLSFCIVAGLIVFPVILQPDLGSTLVLASIAVGIYYVGGAKLQHLAVGGIVALIFSGIVVTNVGYLKNRFKAFLNPSVSCVEDYCWQSEQAKIAIGSGGAWGRGLTQGIQKSYWLPQAVDDFIFAASAEELGFFRIIFVVIAYTVIAYRGFIISINAPNRFSQLVAAGITIWITTQAFVNIAVNASIFPITGITLPLVSYGGSSLVTTLLAIAVLLNISKSVPTNAHFIYRRGNRGTRSPKRRHYRRA